MGKTTRTKAKVLIVDDEGDLSELLQIALDQDYIIETVFEGRAALPKLQEFQPDLVITDSYMPSQDGFNLIDEIRKVSQVALIIVAGAHLRRKMSYFQAKGITAVMVKPFTLKELRSEIQAVLGA